MEIEYVTHASLLLRSANLSLLTDPYFYPELDPLLASGVRNFPPRPIDRDRLGKLDFVFSSHEHHDHCHPETLAQLREQIDTVLLPAERPELERRYSRLGFRRIVLLENRRPLQLADRLEVTCCWDDPIDSFLLVSMDGTLVYHGNDCRPKLQTLKSIAATSRVDFAFVCYTAVQDLFPLLLSRPEEELTLWSRAREEAFFDFQLQQIDALRPRIVIPYSYTAAYVQPEQLHLNGYGRLTPTSFRDRLKLRRPDAECWTLQPGDVIDAHRGQVRPVREQDLWGKDLAELLGNIAEYSESIRAELPGFDLGDPARCDAGLRALLQEHIERGFRHDTLSSWLNDAVVIHVAGARVTASLLVDLERQAVETWPRPRPDRPAPMLEITIPASLIQLILDRIYDPLLILYSHRISFRLHPSLRASGISAVREHTLCVGAYLALFLDAEDKLWEVFEELLSNAGLDMVSSPDQNWSPR
jgi:hypothetical protein